MRLWLTLITQNREKDIDEMTCDTYDIFDGIVAVVNQPSLDRTQEILESRKNAGKIITRPFVKHHAHLMNEFLFSGVMKNEDYFLILDSSDRISPRWIKTLRKDVEAWSANNIGAVFLDRVYLARFYDSMEFVGGVHWGLRGIYGKVVNIGQINGYQKQNWIINTRNNNPTVSAIEHPIKYFVEYGPPSQTQLLYQQFSNEIWISHEAERMRFRVFVEKSLGIECTVKNLIDYISQGITNKNLPKYVVDYVNLEVNMCDLVRHYILKQPLEEIANNRFNWSFKKFYEQNIEHQNKNDGFIGIFNQYKIQKGELPE